MALFFERLCVPSSVVKWIKYSPEKKVLSVTFVSGLIYEYKNVPEETFISMKNSKSKGIFLNNYIKGKFEFEKVD